MANNALEELKKRYPIKGNKSGGQSMPASSSTKASSKLEELKKRYPVSASSRTPSDQKDGGNKKTTVELTDPRLNKTAMQKQHETAALRQSAEQDSQVQEKQPMQDRAKKVAEIRKDIDTAPVQGRVGKAGQAIGLNTVGSVQFIGDTMAQSRENAIDYQQDSGLKDKADEALNAIKLARTLYGEGSKEHLQAEAAYEALRAELMAYHSAPDKAVTKDTLGYQTMQKAQQLQEEALEGTTGVGRFLGNAAFSVADNLSSILASGGNPALAATLMATKAAAGRTKELTDEGVSASAALGRGAISGAIEAATEKVPLDNLMDLVKHGSKNALVAILKQAGVEGTEEGFSYVFNYLADVLAKDPNAKFSPAELLEQIASGAVSGLFFGVGGTAINAMGAQPSTEDLVMDRAMQLMQEHLGIPNAENVLPNAENVLEEQQKPVSQHAGIPQQANALAGGETVTRKTNGQQALPTAQETTPGRDAKTVAADVARVEQYATALGENGSNALRSVYGNEEISGKYAPEDIVHGFYDVYNEAMTGKTMSAEAKLRADALPENVRYMAESSGKEDARRAVQAKYFGKDAKLVRDDNWKKANLSFKTSRKLDSLAKVLGVQVRFVDKIVVDQEGHEANAQYQNGEILISRNTDLPVMTAAIHESVHRLREASPEAYTELSSFVLANMSELGRDFNLAYRAELYQTGNRDVLTEEMVADAYGMMLENSGMLDKMAREHTTVLQRLADSIRDILRSINKAVSLEDLQLSQEEKDTFFELRSQLRGMERAMRNALKTAEAQKPAGKATKNATQEGGATKMMLKRAEGKLDEYSTWRRQTIESIDTNVIVEDEQQLHELISEAFANPKSNKSLHLGVVPQNVIDRINLEAIGVPKELRGNLFKENREQSLEIGQEDIRHLIDDKSGMTMDDVYDYVTRLPEIVTQFDSVQFFFYEQGQNRLRSLRFNKEMEDGVYLSLEVVSRKKNQLETHNIFMDSASYVQKKKHATPMPVRDAQGKTSETLGGYASEDSVHKKEGNVKHSLKSDREYAPVFYSQMAKVIEGSKAEQKHSRSNRGLLDSMIKQYGAIPRGEKPARDILLPTKTADGKNVSWTVRTILEAGATPDELVPTVENLVAKGDLSFDSYTDDQAMADAEARIRKVGWAQSLAEWMEAMNSGNVSKQNTAMGWALYNNAANNKDTETALTILNKMVGHQRSAAQALQATRILKKLAPETQLYQVQRSIESLQEELNERYGEKGAPELVIDKDLAEAFIKAKEQEERDAILRDIYRDIGRQMPSRFMDKWNAWRYLAMLGNPRTHVRNIVGNLGFAPVVATKNLTATAIESVVSRVSGGKLNRSKSIVGVGKKDRALLSAAWSDYDKVQEAALSGGKYSDLGNANQYIEEGRQIFRFKPLDAARKGNSKALDVEDVWFSKPHYAFALASYCKAHNISESEIAKGGKALHKARVYAVLEAQKATYRDTNALSQTISGFGRGTKVGKNPVKKGVSLILEGILPFRKTPANILARGIEYSPIGLMNGIKQALFDVKKGTKTGAEAIDSISAGLTGTGLMALGLYLAAQGLIRGHGSGDDDENEFEELMGHQAYALELPGGTSVTLDWLAPEALPFFVGVNLYEQTGGEAENMNMATILGAVSTVSEPMLEMSCLQSLNDLFDSVGYAASEGLSGLPSALSSAVTSYLTQGLPTILGQAERTGEDKRYSTYTQKNAFLTGDMQYTIGKASARIPGWDFQQIPYIDAWGRTEATGDTGARAFNNFANPSYVSEIDTSDMEEELLNLYKQTGEAGVLPSRAAKYFQVDGERKNLTAEEYVEYATRKGQTAYELLTELMDSRQYRSMSDADKVKAIKEAYDYANQMAKAAISDFATESWVQKAAEAERKYGISQEQYISLKTRTAGITSLKDANGKTIENSKGLQIMQMVYKTPGLTEKQRQAMFEYLGVDKTIRHYNKALVEQKLAAMRKK